MSRSLVLFYFLLASLQPASIGFKLDGSPNSFAQFPTWHHSTLTNELEFRFRTTQKTGLLVYMDDGMYEDSSDFYEMSLIDGSIRMQFRVSHKQVAKSQTVHDPLDMRLRYLSVGTNLSDDKWHTVKLTHSYDAVELRLDSVHQAIRRMFGKKNDGFVFGRFRTNSPVFFGGIAKEYDFKRLRFPLVLLIPRFQGNIQSIAYNVLGRGKTAPVMVSSSGITQSVVDYCEQQFCKTGGRCYSTDMGPKCDCSMTDAKGDNCEIEIEPESATFSGDEYMWYDFTKSGSGFISHAEILSFSFKSKKRSGLILLASDGKDYMYVALVEGFLRCCSNVGGGQLCLDTNGHPDRQNKMLNDNIWHDIILERHLHQVVVSVDGVITHRKRGKSPYYLLTSTVAYVGGTPSGYTLPQRLSAERFVGCLKKVTYVADEKRMDFLKSYQSADGFVSADGDHKRLSRCYEQLRSQPVTFHGSNAFLSLPPWDTYHSNSIGFDFKTSASYALLLYNGAQNSNLKDFVAFEIVDGFLHVLLNFGSVTHRLTITDRRVHNMAWYSTELLRRKDNVTVVLNGRQYAFHASDAKSNLNLDMPLLLGGVGDSLRHSLPHSLWSVALSDGFRGCMRNLYYNKEATDLASLIGSRRTFNNSVGCESPVNQCNRAFCQNSGICRQDWDTYSCECTTGFLDGRNCSSEPDVYDFEGDSLEVKFPKPLKTEADNVRVKIRTLARDAAVFWTNPIAKDQFSEYIAFLVKDGNLVVRIAAGAKRKDIELHHHISDDQWHTIKMERRARLVKLTVDGLRTVQEEVTELPTSVFTFSSIAFGKFKDRWDSISGFSGQMSSLNFDRHDIFQSVPKSKPGSDLGTSTLNDSLSQMSNLFSLVTFLSKESYATATLTNNKVFHEISFAFRTKVPNGRILFISRKSDISTFISIELRHGYLHCSLSTKDSAKNVKVTVKQRRADDGEWHFVRFGISSNRKRVILAFDDYKMTQRISPGQTIRVIDSLMFGATSSLPSHLTTISFVGCLGSFKLNNVSMDLLKFGDPKSAHHRHLQSNCNSMNKPPECKLECLNGGRCVKPGPSAYCDCSFTSYTGKKCSEVGTTVHFGRKLGALLYGVEDDESSVTNDIVFGLRTNGSTADLVYAEDDLDKSSLKILQRDGTIIARLQLMDGQLEAVAKPIDTSDGQYHAIRLHSTDQKFTLRVDDRTFEATENTRRSGAKSSKSYPKWARVYIGASKVVRRRRARSPRLSNQFNGQMSGMFFNGEYVFDLYQKGDARVKPIWLSNQKKPSTKGYDLLSTRSPDEDRPTVPKNVVESPDPDRVYSRMMQTSSSPPDDSFITTITPSELIAKCKEKKANDQRCKREEHSKDDLIIATPPLPPANPTQSTTTLLITHPVTSVEPSSKGLEKTTRSSFGSTTRTSTFAATTSTTLEAETTKTSVVLSSSLDPISEVLTESPTPIQTTSTTIAPSSVTTTHSKQLITTVPVNTPIVPKGSEEQVHPTRSLATPPPFGTTPFGAMKTTGASDRPHKVAPAKDRPPRPTVPSPNADIAANYTPGPKKRISRTTVIVSVSAVVAIIIIFILVLLYKCRRRRPRHSYANHSKTQPEPLNQQHARLMPSAEMSTNSPESGHFSSSPRMLLHNNNVQEKRKKPVKEWFV